MSGDICGRQRQASTRISRFYFRATTCTVALCATATVPPLWPQITICFAKLLAHHRPHVSDSIGATTILMRGVQLKRG